MGWLFAVALGLHPRDRRIVWIAPLPIAIGHAVSVAAVVGVLTLAGLTIEPRVIRATAGFALIAWGLYHWRFGHRHRMRFGMRVGLLGLGLWSLLMATAHGAGLMLWPLLTPLCLSTTTAPVTVTVLGLALHLLTMLAVTVVIAVLVYEWIGVGVLRRAWINLDLAWSAALVVAGTCVLLG
jgi:hypothetical protein